MFRTDVIYAGSITAAHGPARFDGLCYCGRCAFLPRGEGKALLSVDLNGRVRHLTHVRWESFTDDPGARAQTQISRTVVEAARAETAAYWATLGARRASGTQLTPDLLTRGTVFTFTHDYSSIGPRWTERTPGTHFIVAGLSESGATFQSWNTRTGRRDDMLAVWWVFDATRIITPHTEADEPEE